jgi:CheY-like chemotaxis protein
LISATQTIKARSSAAGLSGLELLAQLLESTFHNLYRQGVAIYPHLEDLLLEAYFCLRLPLLSQIRTGQYNSAIALVKARPIFTQLAALLHCQLDRLAELPTPAALDPSVTQTLFREEVSEQLEQLRTDLSLQEGRRSQLLYRAEALLKLAEVLDMPMFLEVCCTLLIALQMAPEQDQAIAQLALQDLETIQSAVLLGQSLPPSIPSTQWDSFVMPLSLEPAQTSIIVVAQRQLSTRRLFACWVGDLIVTLPCSAIVQILLPTAEQLHQNPQTRFLHWQSQMLPIYRFADLMGRSRPEPTRNPLPLIVVRLEQQWVALELRIDRLITETTLAIQPLSLSQELPVLHGYLAIEQDLIPVVDGIALLSQPERVQRLPLPPNRSPAPILIVDDHRAVRQIVELDLQRAGYSVIQAQDVPEALEQLQQHASIQLIICDIEMPELDGFDLLRALRSDRALAKIPVIMLSSRMGASDRALAAQLGARAYLTKPYIKEELCEMIRQILGGIHATI